MRRLCDIPPGQRALVRGIQTQGTMRRRLMELGLVEGTEVTCLRRSPWGDPTAYRIRGAVIALRREDSAGVQVQTPTEAVPWD